jgi:hypothetical protein
MWNAESLNVKFFEELFPAIRYIFCCPSTSSGSQQKDGAAIGARAFPRGL